MRVFFITLFSIFIIVAKAQDSSRIYTKVQTEASYPGGQIEWFRFLGKTLRYPDEAANANKVFEINVIFTVDNTGKVSNVKATSGPENGGMKEEAVRVIEASGLWIPAVQNESPVSSYKNERIVFNFKKPDEKYDPVKKLRGSMDSAAFFKLEIESQYPGGNEGWNNFLLKTMRYPDNAVRNRIQGTAVVRFIVDNDGTVSDIQAISGPDEGGLKEEAIRVIRRSGKWMPAFQYGRYVKSYKKQPFVFRLQN
jgi:TonB family protein